MELFSDQGIAPSQADVLANFFTHVGDPASAKKSRELAREGLKDEVANGYELKAGKDDVTNKPGSKNPLPEKIPPEAPAEGTDTDAKDSVPVEQARDEAQEELLSNLNEIKKSLKSAIPLDEMSEGIYEFYIADEARGSLQFVKNKDGCTFEVVTTTVTRSLCQVTIDCKKRGNDLDCFVDGSDPIAVAFPDKHSITLKTVYNICGHGVLSETYRQRKSSK